MARSVTICIAVLLLLVLVTGLWLRWRPTPHESRPVTHSVQPVAPSTTASAHRADNADAVAPTASLPVAPADDSAQHADEVTAALQSMSTSLSQGDARTPELAPQYEREKPGAEVLANPDLYAEYELGETRKIASIYLSMLGQIPVLRARIEAARTAGSKSDEELAEAEEALAKLEELKREIERDHPDMLPASATVDAPTAPSEPPPADE